VASPAPTNTLQCRSIATNGSYFIAGGNYTAGAGSVIFKFAPDSTTLNVPSTINAGLAALIDG
jgi:hypothetical protein